MSADAEKIVSPELATGESLVWSGRPRTGIRLTRSDAVLIPFSLMWCGFAVFWEKSVLGVNAPPFFPLWGAMFVVVGLYFVFGRFFADALRRGKTFYGLTPRRAIIVSGVFGRQVKSIDLAGLSGVTMSERADRSGTISFGSPSGMNGWAAGMMGPSWPGASRYLPPAFEMIEDAKTVYEKLHELRNTR
ncbi:MAG TPA: hypothetical protein VK989_13600 [Polyangia bacterium]|jgi:hypothetical protein|nr:hypothetical protein [Polyangia bacterium]